MSVPRCAWPTGAGTVCGAELLERRNVASGQLAFACPRCERRKAGICQDCPRRVAGQVGKSLRCKECTRRKRTADRLVWRARHPEQAARVGRASCKRRRDRLRGGPPMPKALRYRRLGELRAAALTPERRHEIAVKAITTRWARERAKREAA